MLYIYRDLRIELDDDLEKVKFKLARKLAIRINEISSLKYYKKSIDARNKKDIFFICSLLFESERKISNKKISLTSYEEVFPVITKENITTDHRPVVVGFGPSGIFAGLYLARKGLKPIIIEQGKCVEEREKDVYQFLKEGKLNTKSNICFGEGGAGTFSDGKLNTNNSDKNIRTVINEFYNHGAPEDILYEGKPHIGTDKLIETVRNIRNEIIELGGEVRFNTTFESLVIENNVICGCIVKDKSSYKIDTKSVFLGIGHSSENTYKYLYENSIALSKKDFAIGLRILHDQEFINKSQYGEFYNHPSLPPASYKLITHLENGRVVFSFCNCPGGEVVNSSCEEDKIVCNGMSNFKRDSKYSNCAILVNVKADDIYSSNPLDGLKYQQEIEHKAYELCGSNILPVQKTTNYLFDKTEDMDIDISNKHKFVDLNGILPDIIENSLKQGLLSFNKTIEGFIDNSCLFGVETRSSSPIRINRNEFYESVSMNNLFVIGEGAGAAGGIMTSAIDGLNAAKCYVERIKGGNK